MEPIHVPRTPSQAFNKNRRVSDLIRAQTNHLKHVEEKMSPSLRQHIPQHAIVSEEDAARYIAAMTHLLRSQDSDLVGEKPASIKRPIPIRSREILDIAAGAEQGVPQSKTKRTTSGQSSSKSKTAGLSRKGKKR